jgi:hypothetical protein
MNEERLAEIETRLGEATPGPWRHGSIGNLLGSWGGTDVLASEEKDASEVPDLPHIEGLTGCRIVHTYSITKPYQHVTERTPDEDGERREWTEWLCRSEADARFLAHARQDVEDLLAEVRRLKG